MGRAGGSCSPPQSRALDLSQSRRGAEGQVRFPRERGRLARKTEFAAGRGLDARDTLTLALSHEGERGSVDCDSCLISGG